MDVQHLLKGWYSNYRTWCRTVRFREIWDSDGCALEISVLVYFVTCVPAFFDEYAASVFGIEEELHMLPKRWHLFAKLQGIVFLKNLHLIVTQFYFSNHCLWSALYLCYICWLTYFKPYDSIVNLFYRLNWRPYVKSNLLCYWISCIGCSTAFTSSSPFSSISPPIGAGLLSICIVED
jgi:hypothetical protein